MAAVTVAIRGLAGLTTPTDLRSVRFELSDDVGGLRVGDDVRVGGFKVGEVHSITLEYVRPKCGHAVRPRGL